MESIDDAFAVFEEDEDDQEQSVLVDLNSTNLKRSLETDDSLSKKSKTLESIHRPVVTDEHSQSVQKEYAVKSSDLSAADVKEATGNIVVSHQVRVFFDLADLIRFDIKWLYRLIFRMCQFLHTLLLLHLLEHIPLRSILFNKRPFIAFNETKAYSFPRIRLLVKQWLQNMQLHNR